MTSASLMHEAGHSMWYSGRTQRDTVGGQWKGVSEWGDTLHQWLIHVNVLQKYHHNIVK